MIFPKYLYGSLNHIYIWQMTATSGIRCIFQRILDYEWYELFSAWWHIYNSKLDQCYFSNGLVPYRYQAIISTNANFSLSEPGNNIQLLIASTWFT